MLMHLLPYYSHVYKASSKSNIVHERYSKRKRKKIRGKNKREMVQGGVTKLKEYRRAGNVLTTRNVESAEGYRKTQRSLDGNCNYWATLKSHRFHDVIHPWSVGKGSLEHLEINFPCLRRCALPVCLYGKFRQVFLTGNRIDKREVAREDAKDAEERTDGFAALWH